MTKICTAPEYEGRILELVIKEPLVLTQFETDWFLLRVLRQTIFDITQRQDYGQRQQSAAVGGPCPY